MLEQRESETGPAPSKATWVAPRIEYVVRLRDCVRGGGKTGVVPDSDPNATTKSGTG
jgi:hypothetical protein